MQYWNPSRTSSPRTQALTTGEHSVQVEGVEDVDVVEDIVGYCKMRREPVSETAFFPLPRGRNCRRRRGVEAIGDPQLLRCSSHITSSGEKVVLVQVCPTGAVADQKMLFLQTDPSR